MTRSTIDRAVGRRLRLARLVMNFTHEDLAASMGVERLEIVRYETGAARLQSRDIVGLVDRLKVPLSWFFLGLEDDVLETGVADEIELALQMSGVKDLQFLREFRELFARFTAAAGMKDERNGFITQARVLMGQRIAARARLLSFLQELKSCR
jgi:transcriptional regulator with XRE-family HTH domain